MALFWTRTWDALAGAFFPTPCVACGELIAAQDPPLCARCWSLLPLIEGNVCSCGAPLVAAENEECGRCRSGGSVISAGVSLGIYAGPLRDCVVALKYRGRHRTAEGLARRLRANNRCAELLRDAAAIVPVPLHTERLRTRGFNQAELLARALAREGGLRVSGALERVRDTPSQTDLTAEARHRNVRDAFALGHEPSLRDAVVVLVDDVTTTGATLRECARTLLAHGVLEVRSITVARAE